MRINKFVALNSSLSRRAADIAIEQGRITVNGATAKAGQDVASSDIVKLDNRLLQNTAALTTILLNKPVGYVVSREGQGSKTVYDLLPPDLRHLRPVGRLDKYSSGLLLLTNNGQLAQQLTHPKYQKTKIYQVKLDRQLVPNDMQKLSQGIELPDGLSHLSVQPKDYGYEVKMAEGRNRQIRRTFETLGYRVAKLHRTQFGDYKLGQLGPGQFVTEAVTKPKLS